MRVNVQDAIIRLSMSTDWQLFEQHLLDEQALVASTLVSINPNDAIEIARCQGRVQTYSAVLAAPRTAEHERDQRTEDKA